MKKLLLSLFILLPLMVMAEEYSGTTGDCTWTLDTETGVMTISGEGSMDNYDSWTRPQWSGKKSYIQSISINNGVTKIGNYSFYECKNLTSVNIPESVTDIGEYAFSYYLETSKLP